MDRRAGWATVHGITKEVDLIQCLDNSNNKTDTQTGPAKHPIGFPGSGKKSTGPKVRKKTKQPSSTFSVY